MTLSYPARFTDHGPDGWVVTFDDMPECLTGGVDLREARMLAIDALGVAIRGRLADGEAIPASRSAGPNEELVELDPATSRLAVASLARPPVAAE